MSEDKEPSAYVHREGNGMGHNGTSDAVYGMALIGALVYFIQHATSFWGVVLGIFKAIIWPAILIYNLLEFLNM